MLKDFHLGNILYDGSTYISDLGMCQSANDEMQPIKNEGVYGVLPYIAPEVLRGYQYTKAADIYSFGIMMNDYIDFLMIDIVSSVSTNPISECFDCKINE
ncbi:kinase-like domain-containing protein [Rhizophagus clarus]|uniref:Kinase-like domain-containing protein n=1 Tax=Rhizophagus clarus TaxID=94130 RepID=A0A8H3MA57_9GLOM|nr:kinase-like domain-containing protein [Rhizophagus clarus]